MTAPAAQAAKARAEQVVERVRSAFPDVWMGMRQRHILCTEITTALLKQQAETWREAAQLVLAHNNPYDVHDCVEDDCKPWIAQECEAKAQQCEARAAGVGYFE